MKKADSITVFLESLEGGGAEQVLLTLINAFAERGREVEVVLCKSGGVFQKRLSPAARLVELRAKDLYRGFLPLVRYLRQKQPRVLLTTLNLASMTALAAKRLSGAPTRVVIRVANAVSKQPKGRFKNAVDRFLQRRIYPWADEILAVSNGVADDLAAHISLPRERVRTIYNPVVTPDLQRLADEPLLHPWFAPHHPPLILAVGRLDVLKDFGTLIRAFAHIAAESPARLLILGEGNQRPVLEALVAELNLNDRVSMPGFVENPFSYMKNADVFVLSSISEGLPAALIQALACGCPVVSTDCPHGPREALEDGKRGKLVPVGDSQALAQAILQTLAAPRPQPDPLWLQRFSLSRIVDEYLKILDGD